MLPSLSVVVPSFNQAQYLEETLLSILNQQYPGLELIVIDGGSTDGSVDIIKKYSSQIAYWVSEPDRGQSHAINKGLEKATGEWVAWMNSDDCYLPGTLVKFFTQTPHRNFNFMHGICSSGATMETRVYRQMGRNTKKDAFAILRFFLGTEYIIPSQSVFIRRSILKEVGLINEALHYVMDMEWFARIALATPQAMIYYYDYPICFYRKHLHTKTRTNNGAMYNEACEVALEMAPQLPFPQSVVLPYLVKHHQDFRQHFSNCSTLWNWLGLLVRFPIYAPYSISFWALFKQLVRKQFGVDTKA